MADESRSQPVVDLLMGVDGGDAASHHHSTELVSWSVREHYSRIAQNLQDQLQLLHQHARAERSYRSPRKNDWFPSTVLDGGVPRKLHVGVVLAPSLNEGAVANVSADAVPVSALLPGEGGSGGQQQQPSVDVDGHGLYHVPGVQLLEELQETRPFDPDAEREAEQGKDSCNEDYIWDPVPFQDLGVLAPGTRVRLVYQADDITVQEFEALGFVVRSLDIQSTTGEGKLLYEVNHDDGSSRYYDVRAEGWFVFSGGVQRCLKPESNDWPGCAESGISYNGDALSVDVRHLKVRGCHQGDCSQTDTFAAVSEAQCARACRVFKDCGFWSFITDLHGAGHCYLRTGDRNRERLSGAVSGARHCFPKKNHAELVRSKALRKNNAFLSGQLISLDRQRAAILKELRANRQEIARLRQPWEVHPKKRSSTPTVITFDFSRGIIFMCCHFFIFLFWF